jgi:hypothetical protein
LVPQFLKCTTENTFVGAVAMTNVFTATPSSIPNNTPTFVTITGQLDSTAILGFAAGFILQGSWGSGTVGVTLMKFEGGSVATAFNRQDIGTEVAACQRYYEQMGSDVNGAFNWQFAVAADGLNGRLPIYYKMPKMRIPTISTTGGGLVVTNGIGNPGITAIGRSICYIQQTGNLSTAMVTVSSTTSSYITIDGRMPLS